MPGENEKMPEQSDLMRFLEGKGARFVVDTSYDVERGLRYRIVEHRGLLKAFAQDQEWVRSALDPCFIHERCAREATKDGPRCVGCGRGVDELQEYAEGARLHGFPDALAYLWSEEGTLNKRNGHFRCTPCYVRAGQPAGTAP